MAEPIRYSIGPLTTYVEPGEFRRDFRKAAPGSLVTYAIGPALGRSAGVLPVVREIIDAGEGSSHTLRIEGKLTYVLRKRAAAVAAARGGEPASVPCRFGPETPEGKVLILIEEAAEAGRACPSNEALAERAGLDSRYAAKHLVKRLALAGIVTIQTAGRCGPRIVTITATGARTA